MAEKKARKRKVFKTGPEGTKVRPVLRDLTPKKDVKGGRITSITDQTSVRQIDVAIEGGSHH